ncbi:MAG: hypothetical protein JST81_12010 [Bacteroidetes bacterium]|nr:hypothetical protein [Bacteroidota bacterium]
MSSTRVYKVSYFFCLAVIGLLAVLIGFAKTFIGPVTRGSFSAPIVVYIHGAFAFSWIMLFIVQSSLINLKKYRTHILLGSFGVIIAFGTAFTMLPVGLFAAHKELRQGLGETAISGFLGVCTSALMFLSIFIAAIVHRKKSATHKRLMLLAIIVVLWPAWFRFRHYFPSVSRPEIWFAVVLADSLILISMIWDKIVNGFVHPVFKYVGTFIILEHTFELIFFDSTTWRVVANFVYRVFS